MSEIKTNKISSLTSSNSDITLDPDGTGNLIVASGNVGIGTTSPGAPLTVQADSSTLSLRLLGRSSDDRSDLEFYENDGTTKIGAISTETDNVSIIASGGSSTLSMTANTSRFRNTSGTELMRVTNGVSGGQVRIGTFGAFGGGNAYLGVHVNSTTKAMVTETGDTSGRSHFSFRNGNGEVGGIDTGGSSTFFNTSSDYRLKENVADMTGAIDRVKALAPKRFNFIADDTVTVDGFLAHEAQAVVPEAVKGTHNEVDDDGNPVMQGIDQSKLVPLLTGALKEAIAKIEALEARVTALENA